MPTCRKQDCTWYRTCATRIEDNCYLARDLLPDRENPEDVTVVLGHDKQGKLTRAVCDDRRQILLYLNTLKGYSGFLSVLFNKNGVLLTGTRNTLIKAARNGQLFEQGKGE